MVLLNDLVIASLGLGLEAGFFSPLLSARRLPTLFCFCDSQIHIQLAACQDQDQSEVDKWLQQSTI